MTMSYLPAIRPASRPAPDTVTIARDDWREIVSAIYLQYATIEPWTHAAMHGEGPAKASILAGFENAVIARALAARINREVGP